MPVYAVHIRPYMPLYAVYYVYAVHYIDMCPYMQYIYALICNIYAIYYTDRCSYTRYIYALICRILRICPQESSSLIRRCEMVSEAFKEQVPYRMCSLTIECVLYAKWSARPLRSRCHIECVLLL